MKKKAAPRARKKKSTRAKPAPARKAKGARAETSSEVARLKRKLLIAERLRFDALRGRSNKDTVDASWLSAGIAHEFNNILGAAEGHATWALESKTPEDMKEALEVVVLACHRAAQITRALQGISQPEEDAGILFEVEEVLAEVGRLWGPLCEQRGLKFRVQAAKTSAYGNPAQLLQILVNLVKNAAEASPAGGEIAIESARRGKFLQVRVRDTGEGIPEPFQKSIFKPFFTSKGTLGSAVTNQASGGLGGGSGLGLFLSKWLAQQRGGDLRLESSRSGETVFLLTIPSAK